MDTPESFCEDRAASSVTAVVGPARGKKCPVCGRAYVARQKNQAHCSRHCYDRAYNLAHPVVRQAILPLDPAPAPQPVVRDRRVPKHRRPHLCAQARQVMARLEEGAVTNRELALMFPPGTAWRTRVSDCRALLRWQYGLRPKLDPDPIPHHDCGDGLVWYWIAPVETEGRA